MRKKKSNRQLDLDGVEVSGYRRKRRRRSGPRRKKKISIPTVKKRRSDISDCLKDAADSYFSHIGYSCYKEIGLNSWGKLRADFVGVNLKSKVVVVEIKSSPSDYKLDKKWDKYLEYADRFFFCVSDTLYKKLKKRFHRELTPKGAGLLVLNPTTGYLEVKLRCKEHKVSDELRLSLITRLAWRTGHSKRDQRNRRRYFLQ